MELHPTSRIGKRLWFIWHDRRAPKWQAFLLGGLVGLVVFALFAVTIGQARAATTDWGTVIDTSTTEGTNVIGVVDPDLVNDNTLPADTIDMNPMYHPPADAPSFATQFKAGKLGRVTTGGFHPHFSKSFANTYKADYVNTEHKAAPKCSVGAPCWVTGAQAWDKFDQHFYWKCMTRAGVDADRCMVMQQSKHWRWIMTHTWDSANQTGPGKTFLNILWCGGAGVVTFYTGGTAAAALGVGGVCLGGWAINNG